MKMDELVSKISTKTNISKRDTVKVLDAFKDIIIKNVAHHESVQVSDLGTFELKIRPAKPRKNAKTGENAIIKATKSPSFRPSNTFRNAVK